MAVRGASTAILDMTLQTGLSGWRSQGAAPPGTVLQSMPTYRFLVDDGATRYFRALPLEAMARAEVTAVLDARKQYKKALFSDALRQLRDTPTLPDLADCKAPADGLNGGCLVAANPARERGRDASPSPAGGRRLALAIGINRYQDRQIPQLIGAAPDSRAVASALRDGFGYEVTTLEDPSKQSLFAAINRLVEQAAPEDSVVIYYAGHGQMVDETDLGYWVPADGRADDPQGWISNADLNRLLARSRSRQITVVADSCFSGRFTQTELGTETSTALAEDLLQRRAVTVMSSGGDEPVADSGRDGRSVFAAQLVKTIQDAQGWRTGREVFGRVRVAVERELPQTPQYGAATSAGHESGGDFVFIRPNRGSEQRR